MKYILFLAIFITLQSEASMPMEETKLNEKLASELGFKFKKTQDKFGLTIELKGPSMFGDSCTPLAAGHFVVKEHEELSAFINSAHAKEPEFISYISDKLEATLIVFIDYECSSEAKRFTVSSNE